MSPTIDAMTEVRPQDLLDDDYLASRAKLIDPERATDFESGAPRNGGTVYLTTADADGMMVSYIQSNYAGFGSGVVVPGTGISLQNRGFGFTTSRGTPTGRAPQAPLPDHHPRLPHEERAAAHELWRDGRARCRRRGTCR
jgi:gamma-glutamyltranspeptidase / glutathione hydrolase